MDTFLSGHYSPQEDAIFREINENIEWGNDVLSEKKKEEEDIDPNQAKDTELPTFSPPDPGPNQSPFTDDENFDVTNLVEMSDTEIDPPSTKPNIFLDTEASEVPSKSPLLRKKSQTWQLLNL